MAIITLSRELGSRGTEIADTLASRLGYAKLDKESLEVLLRESGMSVDAFERDDEKRPGFWEQLTLEKRKYLDFMKEAMYRFAEQKDCIVLGRGGNVIFREVPGALKLRIVAPQRARVERLRLRLGIDEHQALRAIRQSDHDRGGYHRYFFNAAWDSAAEYDLVLNTAETTPAEACDIVASLLRSPTRQAACARAGAALRDLRIAQDVVISILYRSRLAVMFLSAVCSGGTITLEGTVRSKAAADRCAQEASRVEGVTRVANGIQVVEYAYYSGF